MATSAQTIPAGLPAVTSVKAGYKQTEIGVIPDDWDVKRLGEVADYKNGKSFENNIIEGGAYFLITLNSLTIGGKLKKDHLTVNHNDKSLNKNDLVMILSDVAHGNFLGLTDLIPENNKYVLNQRVGALKNIRFIEPYFLSKYINLKQKYFKLAGQGSSQLNLSKDDILNFEIAFPTLKKEQDAIAEALSDVDSLIDKLGKLIEKKKMIKQGTMQELLTGKRRLPGFEQKWETKKLGELAKIYRGASPRPIEDPRWFDEKSSVGWVRISDVTISKKYLIITKQKLSADGIRNSRPTTKGSLIMSICATVGRPIITKIDTCIHDGFVVFDSLRADVEFVYYFLASIEDKWALHGQTGSQMNLNTGLIQNEPCLLPSDKDEQKAIAEILNDMDSDIEKLQIKLAKYQDIKQGMMQVLLTGKIRLINK